MCQPNFRLVQIRPKKPLFKVIKVYSEYRWTVYIDGKQVPLATSDTLERMVDLFSSARVFQRSEWWAQ